MRTTRYFDEQVIRKRPYLDLAMCASVIAAPLRAVTQIDGRVRYWGRIVLAGENEPRVLRVVVLEDGTLHNAFLDRSYREDDR